jgi:hypothetical protein
MAGLRTPLPTLRLCPHGHRRTAQGRCGSLTLHRVGLPPTTPCRSPGALAVHPVRQGLAVHATRLGRQLPRMIIQHHRDRQQPPRLPWVLRSRRLGAKLASGQVVTSNLEQSRRLPRESTSPRIDSQPAAFENPQRVKNSGGWYYLWPAVNASRRSTYKPLKTTSVQGDNSCWSRFRPATTARSMGRINKGR